MFIATQFTIEKIWKQTKCLITDDLIMKLLNIYMMKKHFAFKNDKTIQLAAM